MPSLTSWILQTTACSTFAAAATFVVYTKHCHFTSVSEQDGRQQSDPIFQSALYKKFNPQRNPSIYDVCVRKIPLWKLERELIDDAEVGGGKLVEKFCGGVWGCFGYTPQRKFMQYKYRSDPTTQHQLWDKQDLLSSTYPKGTEITNHFQVVEKTPTTILIRCGDSPLVSPSAPRDSDGLFEIHAHADLEKGFAEFRLTSCFFQGSSSGKIGGDGEKEKGNRWAFEWAHRMYTKLLMESGIKNTML